MVDTDGVPYQNLEEIPAQEEQAFDDPNRASSGELDHAYGSILVADCGSSFTRVSLLERAETGFCFVAHAKAHTTAEPPWSDVSIGVRHGIEQITEATGRSLLDDSGSLIIPEVAGEGVDLCVITCSAAQPLRIVLAGLMSQVSLASLERAAASAYVEVSGVIARDYAGVRTEHQPSDAYATYDRISRPASPRFNLPKVGARLSDEDKIAIIRQQHPDIVWVAGGTNGGSREPVRDLVETVALACTLVDSSPQPDMVYAGNAELRSEVAELVGEEVGLEVIDNVRPTVDTENLASARAAFQAAYLQRKVHRLPGIGNLTGWSNIPVLPTAQTLEYLVLYLQNLYESGKGVLCVDVGSANTIVAASFPAQPSSPEFHLAAGANGSQHTLRVATNLGVGYGALGLLERVGVRAIVRWLPFEPKPGEIEAVLLNKSVRPTTVPQDQRQLLIEQAAAREALRLVMSQTREVWQAGTDHARRWVMPLLEPIIASGGVLVEAPRPSQAALMLLDAVEPVGISTLLLDKHGAASALGAVAAIQPLAAVEALDAGAFLTLGTVIAPIGRARPGEAIMRVRVVYEKGGELEVEVQHGSLELLPLPIDEKATLELRPRRGIRVGRAGKVVEVNGGAVGLVIDARGRPLRLPSNLDQCRQLAQQWLWEMGA